MNKLNEFPYRVTSYVVFAFEYAIPILFDEFFNAFFNCTIKGLSRTNTKLNILTLNARVVQYSILFEFTKRVDLINREHCTLYSGSQKLEY
jgi:hypothetical protein